jgi:HAD superfamily hydrolase (TIGR01509 family)
VSAVRFADLLAGKRLLIFDFDGTLVDSSPLHARAFSAAFAPLGIPVDYERIAGITTPAAVDKILAEARVDLAAEQRVALVREKQQHVLELLKAELKPIEGAVAFLEAARSRCRLALCTSGSLRSVSAALAKTNLVGMFDPLITAEDVKRSKPDPEGFLLALRHARLAPAEALIFEDAESGLAAARAAGIDAVHIVPQGQATAPGQADWATMKRAFAALPA